MNICKKCGKEYAPGDFGSGPSYCSRKCAYPGKWGKGVQGPGRPRRYPKPTPLLLRTVRAQLESRGWKVSTPYKEKPYRLVIQRGWFKLRLSVSGGGHEPRWADCVAYRDAEAGRIRYESPCLKKATVIAVPKYKGAPRLPKYTRAEACKSAGCRQCTRTQWLQQLFQMDDAKEVDNDSKKA